MKAGAADRWRDAHKTREDWIQECKIKEVAEQGSKLDESGSFPCWRNLVDAGMTEEGWCQTADSLPRPAISRVDNVGSSLL